MSLPIKILIVGPFLNRPGGIENYNTLLIRYLNPAKIHTHYFTLGRRTGSIRGATWFRPIDFCLNQVNFAWTTLRLRPRLIVLNPSLFWSALIEPLGMLLTARLTQQKALVVLHGWDEDLAAELVRRSWRGRLLSWFLRQAQHLVVLSDRFKEQLVISGIPPERISISTPMVEPILTQPGQNDQPHHEDDRFAVLWLGRMVRVKGIWETLAAAEILHQEHGEAAIKFVLAGDGPEMVDLQARVAELGLEDIVYLPGFVRDEQRANLYHSADLFVLPSLHTEGFPAVILEAMSAGLPLIYTPAGRLAELLSPDNGLAIDAQELSGASLAGAIWSLYQEPSRRQAMSAVNQEIGRQYSVDTVCRQLENIYLTVAAG